MTNIIIVFTSRLFVEAFFVVFFLERGTHSCISEYDEFFSLYMRLNVEFFLSSCERYYVMIEIEGVFEENYWILVIFYDFFVNF